MVALVQDAALGRGNMLQQQRCAIQMSHVDNFRRNSQSLGKRSDEGLQVPGLCSSRESWIDIDSNINIAFVVKRACC